MVSTPAGSPPPSRTLLTCPPLGLGVLERKRKEGKGEREGEEGGGMEGWREERGREGEIFKLSQLGVHYCFEESANCWNGMPPTEVGVPGVLSTVFLKESS